MKKPKRETICYKVELKIRLIDSFSLIILS